MGKKRKGPLDYIMDFFGLIFSAVKFAFGIFKWIALSLWGAISWLSSFLKKKGQEKAELETQNRRSKAQPVFAPLVEIEPENGTLEKFESELYSGKSLIGLVIGARGSGKSAVGMRVLENMRAKGANVYAMGFGKETLPAWISLVDSVGEVKPNSFLLVDEGGIEFSSRDSMSERNKLLTDLLLISRHNDLSILFITQNSANIEINTLRQVDYLLLKEPSLLQLDFERKTIKDIYMKSKPGFEKHADVQGIMYVHGNKYSGFASNSLPSFWSNEVSKAYRGKQQKA